MRILLLPRKYKRHFSLLAVLFFILSTLTLGYATFSSGKNTTPNTKVFAAEPTEVPPEKCEIGSPDNERWAPINEYDEFFAQAAEEFNVDGNLMKAMAMIESGGAGHAPNGQVLARDDGFGDGLSIGIMQVKPSIWQSLVPDADAYDPLGNIRLGSAIMAKAIQDHGSWENALTRVYFPSNDPNGTTQQMYVTMVNKYMDELGGADCGSTTGKDKDTLTPGKSACVVTKVGNPLVSPVLPPGCGGRGGAPCQKPTEPYPTDLIAEIKNTWDISIIGEASPDQLKWIYEIFYAVSSTPFLDNVKGTIIDVTGRNGSISYQIGCPGNDATDVELANTLGETGIKGIIIHELTHVFQFCNEDGISNLSTIYSAYDREGGLTEYSRTGCGLSGINLYNEDHAETISLHLNPNLSSQACGNDGTNPYDSGRFPLHKAVAVNGVGEYSCSL